MSNQDNSLYSAHGAMIRDLCLARVFIIWMIIIYTNYMIIIFKFSFSLLSPHLLSYTEAVMLIEHLCTAQQCCYPYLMYITFLPFLWGTAL